MLRILIINTLYYPSRVGGAEVSVQLLAEQLVKSGFSVRIIALTQSKIRKEDIVNSVSVVYLPLKNVYFPFSDKRHPKWKKVLWHLIDLYNPLMKRLLIAEIEDFNPNLVHTNNLAGFSVSAWHAVKKFGLPLVHTARDYYLFHPNCTLFKNGENQSIRKWDVRLLSFLKKKLSKNIDVFVGISRYVVDIHSRGGFTVKRKSIIYNPILSKSIVRIQNDSSEKIIGFMGRLTEEKGFDEYCRIAQSYKAFKGVSFIAAGKFSNGSLGIDLRRLAENSGVKLVGFLSPQEFFSQVDVVILPVKWCEPFGRVVAEAAVQGIPVYTNFYGGILDVAKIYPNVKKIEFFNEDFQSRSIMKRLPVKNLFKNCFQDYIDLYDSFK